MSTAWIVALGPILSLLITGGFSYLIKRSADKATTTTRRDAIEAAAFKRAEEIYNNALDRAKAENTEAMEKIARLERHVASLEGQVETERGERRHAITTAHRELSDLRIKIGEYEATIAQLKRVIASQKRGDLPPAINLDEPPDLPAAGPPPPKRE